MASFAFGSEDFKQIVAAMSAEVHPEAITLAKNLVGNNWRKFALMPGNDNFPHISDILGSAENFTGDREFLKEDLETLVELGIYNMEFNTAGTPIFTISRTGQKLFGQSTKLPQ